MTDLILLLLKIAGNNLLISKLLKIKIYERSVKVDSLFDFTSVIDGLSQPQFIITLRPGCSPIDY